ncbi:hypothetical protein QF030_000064 [Streptomyces rishiriensis]|uniref:Uncharacterized protein n=1 Tax=Streptomyces rishiriensis TaxID=68264 RepID=A0ABU0NFN4_STRRH|nr:hypothetical protein [Streptomyces rishiriensis]
MTSGGPVRAWTEQAPLAGWLQDFSDDGWWLDDGSLSCGSRSSGGAVGDGGKGLGAGAQRAAGGAHCLILAGLVPGGERYEHDVVLLEGP